MHMIPVIYFWQSDEMSLSGSTFTVRFPASSGTLMYDPTLELTLIADNGEDEFWRKAWFIWTAASLGVLVREITELRSKGDRERAWASL